MFKRYSIRQRIWQFIVEIITGSLLVITLTMGMGVLLKQTGQLALPSSSSFSVDLGDVSISAINQKMRHIPYDYVIFDKKSGNILGGTYQKSDLLAYKLANNNSGDVEKKGVTYTYASNEAVSIVVRHSTLPEFTNARLRHISYNKFSYVTVIVGVFLTIVISVYRLAREYQANFKEIQKLALNMGKSTLDFNNHLKILEFNNILNNLTEKNNELVYLINKERHEKEDLSFQVGALSHDVRTPLTVLKGNIELLETTIISKEQSEFLEAMKRSLLRFDNYFSQMMDYTKLLNEDDHKEYISLELFLSDTCLLLNEFANTYGVSYHEDIQVYNLDIYINSHALSRAITNIFVNACQYARKGGKKVYLNVYLKQDRLCFSICNNGEPFSESAKKNASKLFYTEDSGRTGKHYGIGLAFAKEVAFRHDGILELRNPPGGGAEVILQIKV